MIPSIEEILAGLKAGQYTLARATLWIYKHQEIAGATADIVVRRDEFAGRAMAGWLATYGDHPHPASDGYAETVAKHAYAMADAMLKARKA